MQLLQLRHANSALTFSAEADAAAVTVVVAVVSLPAADVVASATVVAVAVAVAALATVVVVAAAVVVLAAVAVELLAAVVVVPVAVLVVERTLTPRSLWEPQMANFAAARLLSSPIATPVSLSLAARRISSSPRT